MTLSLLIHAPTAAALSRARNNLRNFLIAEPSATLELIANGEALRAALAAPDAETAPYLVLCENSLKAAGLEAPVGTRTVAAAVHHIAVRQSEGWSYFRA